MEEKFCIHHLKIEKMIDVICNKLDEKEKISDIKFAAMSDAVRIAKEENDRRLEGMNEFRVQLSQQATTFVSKREVELLLEKQDTRIKSLENNISERKGSSKWSDHIITVLISIAVFALAHYLFKF